MLQKFKNSTQNLINYEKVAKIKLEFYLKNRLNKFSS